MSRSLTPRSARQTVASLRAQLSQAEDALPALERTFQEAALAELSGDDLGAEETTRAAREALQQHKADIAKLQAALPAAERQQAAALAAAQAKLRAQHVTRLGRELKELEKESLRFS